MKKSDKKTFEEVNVKIGEETFIFKGGVSKKGGDDDKEAPYNKYYCLSTDSQFRFVLLKNESDKHQSLYHNAEAENFIKAKGLAPDIEIQGITKLNGMYYGVYKMEQIEPKYRDIQFLKIDKFVEVLKQKEDHKEILNQLKEAQKQGLLIADAEYTIDTKGLRIIDMETNMKESDAFVNRITEGKPRQNLSSPLLLGFGKKAISEQINVSKFKEHIQEVVRISSIQNLKEFVGIDIGNIQKLTNDKISVLEKFTNREQAINELAPNLKKIKNSYKDLETLRHQFKKVEDNFRQDEKLIKEAQNIGKSIKTYLPSKKEISAHTKTYNAIHKNKQQERGV